MNPKELVIALPTASREKAFEFYKALGFELARDPNSQEIPEPLEFRLTSTTVLMLIPRDGFAFVVQNGNTVAENNTYECVQSFIVNSNEEVDQLIEKARKAGGEITTEPSNGYMGYAGQFKDLDGHLWMVGKL